MIPPSSDAWPDPPRFKYRTLHRQIDARKRFVFPSDYVECNLSDPDLSVESIAARLKCSKRYLHQAFDDAGLGLGRYIWKRLLERCKDDLVDANRAGRSLSDIAFAWGFSSLAHFSKAFKHKFGAAPSEFRRRSTICQEMEVHR